MTSVAELDIVNKSDINCFPAECEILKLRRDDLTNKMFHIDEEIEKYINESQVSPEAKQKLQNRWNECINEDKLRIDSKRKLKIISTKKAASKDKEFYTNHQLSRLSSKPQRSPPIDTNQQLNSIQPNIFNKEIDNQVISERSRQEPSQSKNELVPVSPERNKYMLRSSTYQERY